MRESELGGRVEFLVSVAKIFILKREGIIERISYERRAYESVDDRSHS